MPQKDKFGFTGLHTATSIQCPPTTTISFIEQTGTANMRIIGTGMFSRTGSFILHCTTNHDFALVDTFGLPASQVCQGVP